MAQHIPLRHARGARREVLKLRREERQFFAVLLADATRYLEHLLAQGAPATDVEGALLSREDAYQAHRAVALRTVPELWYFIRELFDWEPELVLIIKWMVMVRPRFKSRECKTTGCTLLTLSGTGWCPPCRRDDGRDHYPAPAVTFDGCGLKGCDFQCCCCGACECQSGAGECDMPGLCYLCT